MLTPSCDKTIDTPHRPRSAKVSSPGTRAVAPAIYCHLYHYEQAWIDRHTARCARVRTLYVILRAGARREPVRN